MPMESASVKKMMSVRTRNEQEDDEHHPAADATGEHEREDDERHPPNENAVGEHNHEEHDHEDDAERHQPK